ncbi:MAG: hypothetical protein VX901_01325 [Candidatus Poribacteria bacterium]|nr:hypothetical protein [Candidatus Poribacteria bacterium]
MKDNLDQQVKKLQVKITQARTEDHLSDLQATKLVTQLDAQQLQLQDLGLQQSRWSKICSLNT